MKTAFKGQEVNLTGTMVKIQDMAPDFSLRKIDFSDYTLSEHYGKYLILNIFLSVDTAVCSASVRRFNQEAAKLKDTQVLCISMDLPFAQERFCGAEGIKNVIMLSAFDSDFGSIYGVRIAEGPLRGLLARSIIILNPEHRVIYTQLVPEITQNPDFEKALAVLK